jgi:hypothetical protein
MTLKPRFWVDFASTGTSIRMSFSIALLKAEPPLPITSGSPRLAAL